MALQSYLNTLLGWLLINACLRLCNIRAINRPVCFFVLIVVELGDLEGVKAMELRLELMSRDVVLL